MISQGTTRRILVTFTRMFGTGCFAISALCLVIVIYLWQREAANVDIWIATSGSAALLGLAFRSVSRQVEDGEPGGDILHRTGTSSLIVGVLCLAMLIIAWQQEWASAYVWVMPALIGVTFGVIARVGGHVMQRASDERGQSLPDE